ncbi:monovalent cation/H+ antiporter subunit D family protein [Sanguibacter sp. Leaf3]|uniref:monovalent cation/H+ antiporter subunit D family protein n=1 Tax=Sanguibacter sp. Leaf3 TaxID=1736209 RepID=UPI0006F51880|nr:monovalent cation/H+ antiporter subunit D family protein [Sanguibacter sp. Leaf3]KQU00199.1 cation:proton antiporter [Sanguibacter sp. Leaf3]
MTPAALPLFVAVPLLTAAALVLLRGRPRLDAVVLGAVLLASTTGGVVLVAGARDGSVLAHGVGLWPVGIAIPFAADMLTALMLTVTGLLSATCAAFAVATGHAARPFFAPLVLVLTAGVNGALLTADLFNLFVFIEVMLLPSYALFVLAGPGKGRLRQVAGARLYVTVNLLTSTVFLAGVAFVYGVAGTVNLAELAGAARDSDAVAAAVAVCLFALGIKAAVVPVHGWLARAYPATSPAVTALFSGLHTKVAIYAIYRVYAVVFDGDERYLWVGVVVFSLTMVVGVLGAVGETTTRSILAFHMVSQIGYILLGVALFTLAGLTAGIFYLLHHMIVKASLFLSTGAVEERYGTGRLDRLGGLARREPWVAVAFFAAALSLAGLPPSSGFVAKLSLLVAAQDAGQTAAVVVMVLVSLVTLLSMLKIWSGVFWGSPTPPETDDPDLAQHSGGIDPSGGSGSPAGNPSPVGTLTVPAQATAVPQRRIGAALVAPGLVLAVVTLGLGLGAELLLGLAETAAAGLLDPSAFVEAVTGS